jgi:aminopeptidase N
MQSSTATTTYRSDYQPPDHLINHVLLEFDLDATRTQVRSTLRVRRNPAGSGRDTLHLDGDSLELAGVALDGRPLAPERLRVTPGGLAIEAFPESAVLTIDVRIAPERNTALMGLYLSNGSLFTQCEAEGFRRITYFPDRPDVMATYEVLLRADAKRFPVLLANGNLADAGKLADGRHYARWSDPFPKPSYLFALVAGRFEALESRYSTRSGRQALLQVYTAPGEKDRARHALASLERAIRFDEERFDLELDLDRFMVVASHDFNGGAMENKGLNIFNARFVLADPQIATDNDFEQIESMVGHEYFHNWTGNRVTCRDWFQLSLKEGLTAMAGDAASAGVRRIDAVRKLRARQYPEDAGPMAHPVRPDSYEDIGNFYTPTVYEKGAELVRMLQVQLGVDGFARGLKLYFERHDGQAVTCDDFVAAMADANGADLTLFSRWYAQAGTPRLVAVGRWDAQTLRYELLLSQSTPPTPGQPEKLPLPIPLSIGLVGPAGRDLPLQLEGEARAGEGARVLTLTGASGRFVFINVRERPVPSIGRGFSAPVVLDSRIDDDDLVHLAHHDSDPFNRWEAIQRLATAALLRCTDAFELDAKPQLDTRLVEVTTHLLDNPTMAPAFCAQALRLPDETFLAEQRVLIDAPSIRRARLWLLAQLGAALAPRLQKLRAQLAGTRAYSPDPASAGRRALSNLALEMLAEAGGSGAHEEARAQFDSADNLTDRLAALAVIVNSRGPVKADLLVQLARDWSGEPLLMNKWFQLQATAVARDSEVPVLERVRVLTRHKGYSNTNPNSVYALVLGFCGGNPAEFHRADGAGYRFWTEQVLALDRINPTVAARLARTLENWRRHLPARQQQMQAALSAVAAEAKLSREVREIVGKALAPV